MARPQKNNCDYFSHDNDMRNDDRIKAVRRKFGNEGYAVWNMFLETLCNSTHLFIKIDTIRLETLAGDFNVDSETLMQMIEYFCNINLLQRYEDCFICEKLVERLVGVISRRSVVIVDQYYAPEGLLLTLTRFNLINVINSTQIKGKESKVKGIDSDIVSSGWDFETFRNQVRLAK